MTVGGKWRDEKAAKITPKEYENIIEIEEEFNARRTFYIVILKDENKAILKQRNNSQEICKFYINDCDLFWSIETKTNEKIIDFIEIQFFYRCKEHLINFLIKLRTQITSNQPYFDSLYKDENFKKALDYLDKELKLK